MKRRTMTIFLLALAAVALGVATTRMAKPPTATLCTDAWYAYVEKEYATPSDGEGHGPDRAVPEWFSSVEHQVGLPNTSGQTIDQRCVAMQRQLQHRTILISNIFGAVTIWN